MESPDAGRRLHQYFKNNSVFYDLFRKARGWLAARRHNLVHGNYSKEQARWVLAAQQPRISDIRQHTLAQRRAFGVRLKALAQAIQRFGAKPVFVTQTWGDVKRGPEGYYELHIEGRAAHPAASLVGLELLNEITLSVCQELELLCLDLASEVEFSKTDFYDHIHTSPAGSEKIGDFLFDKLREVL